MDAPQSLPVSAVQIVILYCPLCAALIDRVGADLRGTLLPFCRKCKNVRPVKLVEGKIIIEAELPSVYTPAENSGEHPDSATSSP